MVLESGTLVRVRSRQYLVEEVSPGSNPGEQTLVRLSCIDDDCQGAPLEVLWEKEADRHIIAASTWKDIAKHWFDPHKQCCRYLDTFGLNPHTSPNPRLFQAPYR